MAAYAEGLNILRHADVGKRAHAADAETTPLAQSRALPVRLRSGRDRRGLAARQRHRLLAARPDRRRAGEDPDARRLRRARVRLGRRALDGGGGDRRGACRRTCSPRRSSSGSARAARPTSRTGVLSAMRFEFGGHVEKAAASERAALRCAGVLRRHRRSRLQEDLPGASRHGAARAAQRPGHRRRPIGVDGRAARGRAPARASSEHGGASTQAAFARCCERLRYVGGRLPRPATFAALRGRSAARSGPLHYLAIPPSLFADRRRWARPIGLRRETPASSWRSRSDAISRRRAR